MGHSQTNKARLRRARGQACPYCGDPMEGRDQRPTMDHIWPKALGGTLWNADGSCNIVIVCGRCNFDKSDMTLEEYRDWLREMGWPNRTAWVELFIGRLGQRKTPQDLRPAGSELSSECAS